MKTWLEFHPLSWIIWPFKETIYGTWPDTEVRERSVGFGPVAIHWTPKELDYNPPPSRGPS